MAAFLFSFYLLINIVRYTAQTLLWRYAYRRFFRLPDSGEEAYPRTGKCFSGMLKSFWAAEKTSCCWLEPTKIRRRRIGKENLRLTASPVAGNPAVRGQSYDDKRLWSNILSNPIVPISTTCCQLSKKWYNFHYFHVYLYRDSKKQWFEDMKNDIVKFPKIQTDKHLPIRLSVSSDTCISDVSMIYGFNYFMTYCRQSSTIWNIVSPMHLICDEQLSMRRFIKAKNRFSWTILSDNILNVERISFLWISQTRMRWFVFLFIVKWKEAW